MSELRKLKVDMEEILSSMIRPAESYDTPYLDDRTGEVYHHPAEGDALSEEDDPEGTLDREHHHELPRQEGGEGYRLMVEFAETVDERDIRGMLAAALDGKGAFRRFKDVVFRYPDLAERWDAHERLALLRAAIEWLHSLGIEPTYELRPRQRASTPPSKPKALRIGLDDILVLGAPSGRTEILDASVHREFIASSVEEARRVFKDVARDLCERKGEAWRNRFIEGATSFERDDVRIELKGDRVEVRLRYTMPVLHAFGYCRGGR